MANSTSTLGHEELRAECQHFLTTFRVLELKELLKVQGQSTKGRKPELFQRANDMLQHGSPKFQTMIRDIYERSNHCRRRSSHNRALQRSSPMKKSVEPVRKNHHAYIVHPDVRFKDHPFFSKLETISRPTALVSSGMSGHGSLSMKLKFHLTPQQIHQIYISKTSTGTYQTQILVRFCLQETTCDQNDFYPKQCYVKVNGHSCPIPGYHPHLSTRPDYKRNGQPVNVTNFVKTSPTEINEVHIYWSHDIMVPQGYCVGIEICKVVTSSDLMQALKAKGVRSPDMSRALVREKFVVDKDSEVAATSMKVSLLCPIGKMRMTYPCRTIHCNHLQCFDASIFYQMNEKRARWVCPVCDKGALPGDLFIDGLFMEICQQSPSSDSIIEFSDDGSWKPAPETSSTSLLVETPDRRGNSPISLDTPETSKKKSDVVVIDLTASSDEEEEEDGEGEEDLEEGEVREDGEDEGEETGTEVGVERNINNQHSEHPRIQTRRTCMSDNDAASDSESTDSTCTSSTVTAPSPLSPPPPHSNLPHSTTNSAYPHLSIPLTNEHSPSVIFPGTSHVHSNTLSPNPNAVISPSQHDQRQPSAFSITIPTSSVSLRRLSSESPAAISSSSSPSATSTDRISSAASASRTTSVITQCRSHSSPRHHSSNSHAHSQFHSHSRIRKRSHSGPQLSQHRHLSHSSHPSHHNSHSLHRFHPSHNSSNSSHHSSHHKHTHTSSRHHHSRSSAGSGRGQSASVPSLQGASHLAPYFPLQINGYPRPGDALLTSTSFDESLLNFLHATSIVTSSLAQSHPEADD